MTEQNQDRIEDESISTPESDHYTAAPSEDDADETETIALSSTVEEESETVADASAVSKEDLADESDAAENAVGVASPSAPVSDGGSSSSDETLVGEAFFAVADEEVVVSDEEEDADEMFDDDEEDDEDVFVYDADKEEATEEALRLARLQAMAGPFDLGDDVAPGGGVRNMSELMSIIEALIFVSDEPLQVKMIADVLDEERGWVAVAVEELAKEFNERNGGLIMREVAGGWQIATRPEYHEHIRAFLKSRPSAKLSLAALETLAVIAYKQPITVPEILEIRGVQSSSAIKTLLDKRLIVAKGRKETVGRPMLYGTSKEFLLQFGLKDLSELPSIEDFDDLTGGGA
ncbi:MAG TPA: SMC-Scp complex subunit ScpB [Pyrinomonadaceae bacterium]|jgi:segregation and condensation protein B